MSRPQFETTVSIESYKEWFYNGRLTYFPTTGVHYPIHSYRTKWQLFETDNYTCRSCGMTVEFVDIIKCGPSTKYNLQFVGVVNDQRIILTIDHIFPLSCGGDNKSSNLQSLCSICNNIKGDRLLAIDELRDERRALLERKIYGHTKRIQVKIKHKQAYSVERDRDDLLRTFQELEWFDERN